MTAACPACSSLPEPQAVPDVTPNVTLSVPSMHCAGCMGSVERALNDLDGVTGARVNLTLKRVSAHSDRPVEALVQGLASAGYQAFPLDAQVLDSTQDPVGRDLLLRLGVAGFAMMNVMLLSVAVWSGAADATRDLFHLISAAIALPVVGFSAQPFFRHAWTAVKAFRMNMDVPISLAIILAAVMSLYESLHGGHHAYFDAAISLTFFLLIGRYLEHRTKASARSAAKELAALEVQTAERKQGARVETVPISALAIGDIVLVPTGTRVPADGTLDDAEAVTDRSFLTGESDPVTHARGTTLRAGEINLGAPFTVIATAVGDDTSLRQMARLVELAEGAKNRYTSLADRAAQAYAPVVHILAGLAFAGWYIGTGDFRLAINIAIAVLIITCPCALGLAVPAVSTAAIGKLYNLGFLVKSGTALERLAEVDTVVFDKTGTLTRPTFDVSLDALPDRAKSVALGLAQASTHPVSRALSRRLDGVEPAEIEGLEEISGKGIAGHLEGTPVMLGQAPWTGAAGFGLALRVGDETWSLSQSDHLREGAETAVSGLGRLGLRLRLLSGDSQEKTAAMAQTLGFTDFSARQTPEGKTNVISALEDKGNRVCMVGDGLNDTVALASAYASVAPSSALEAARTAADVVLVRDDMTELPTLIRTARRASQLSRQNFSIATIYNMLAIPFAMAGFATPMLAAISMSTSSITVLLNALRVRI